MGKAWQAVAGSKWSVGGGIKKMPINGKRTDVATRLVWLLRSKIGCCGPCMIADTAEAFVADVTTNICGQDPALSKLWACSGRMDTVWACATVLNFEKKKRQGYGRVYFRAHTRQQSVVENAKSATIACWRAGTRRQWRTRTPPCITPALGDACRRPLFAASSEKND